MSVTEILSAAEKLTDDERQQVLDALLRRQQTGQPTSDDEKHAELYRRLLANAATISFGMPVTSRSFQFVTSAERAISFPSSLLT